MNSFIEFIKSVFKIDNNTAATIIITLCVLVISQFLAWVVRVYIQYNENKKLKKIFKSSLNKLIEQFKEQSSEFARFAGTVNFENDTFTLRHKSFLPISAFENIGYSKWIEVLVLNNSSWKLRDNKNSKIEKTDVFLELWNILISSYYWQERSRNEFEKFIFDYNVLKEQHDTTLKELFNYIEELRCASQESGIPDTAYSDGLIQIRKNFNNNDSPKSADTINENLIIPLLNFINQNANVKYSIRLRSLLVESDKIFNKSRRLIKLTQRIFDDYSKNFNHNASSCSDYLKKLN